MDDDDYSALAAIPGAVWMRRAIGEIDALDRAVFAAVVETRTPTLDVPLRTLSRAADHSKLWAAAALLLAAGGGRRGRRAAVSGLVSLGVASATVNLALKYGAARPRPERGSVNQDRHVPMPTSTSFPSGHSASAFAFAVGAGTQLPLVSLPLNAVAALVAYSRIHAGVHYPSDVMAGAAVGGAAGTAVSRLLSRAGWRI